MNPSTLFRFAANNSPQGTGPHPHGKGGRPENGKERAQGRRLARPLFTAIGVLAPLLFFGYLAEDVATRESIRFDTPLLLGLHAHATPLFDRTMLAFTNWGGVRILLLSFLLSAFLLWRKQRVQAAFLLWAMLGAALLNVAIKASFQRVRPDLWLSLAPEHDYGFPSGHSMLSCAFVLAALVLTWKSRSTLIVKWGTTGAGLLFLLGVGLSRLYLGVHYPSDVLAGFALVLSWITLLQGIFEERLEPTQR